MTLFLVQNNVGEYIEYNGGMRMISGETSAQKIVKEDKTPKKNSWKSLRGTRA